MPREKAIRTEHLGRIYKLKPTRKQKREARKERGKEPPATQLIALDNVDVEVHRCEVFGLLGPNNQRIEDLLSSVGLSDRGSTKISDLSTGLRRKMDFFRGFITDPQIIFLGEPTIDQGKILACDTPFNLKRTQQRDSIFRLRVTYLPEASDRVCDIDGVRQCIQRHGEEHTELDLTPDAEDVLAPVIAALSAQQARLLALEKREPTLEDVFVDLVGQGLDEDTSQQTGVE